MKSLAFSRVAGRREGEETVWKFSPMRLATSIMIPLVTALIIGWVGWVSKCSIAGDAAKKTTDHQIPVLHNRITDQGKQRDAAVQKILDKIDTNQAAQNVQNQAIMDHLIQIQRDMRNE